MPLAGLYRQAKAPLKPTANTGKGVEPPMTAVAVELLLAPPAPQDAPDPDAITLVADTDKLMTMYSCAASSDNPY